MNWRSLKNRLGGWARAVQRDAWALWYAARDPRVPWYAKAVAWLVVAYAISPIDLIPDFIPVLGQLDDLIIVPLGLWLAVRLIPAPLFAEHRRKAAERTTAPPTRLGTAMVIVTWIAAAALLAWWLVPPTSALDGS